MHRAPCVPLAQPAIAILLLVSSLAAAEHSQISKQAPPPSDFSFWVGGGRYSSPSFSLPSSPDNWLGGTGNWSNGADWSAGEPGSSSDVFINTSNDYVTLDTSTSINSLTLGGSIGSSTLIDQTGNGGNGYIVNIAGALTINQSGTLTLTGPDQIIANADSVNAGTINLGGNAGLGTGSQLSVNGNFTNSGGIQLTGYVNSITVSGNLSNMGSIQDHTSGGDNTISVGSLTNSGSITLENSGDRVTANATSSNAGGITLFANTSLQVNGDFTNSGGIALNGVSGVGGTSVNVSGNFTNTNRGSIQDTGAVDSLSVGGNLTNAGGISIAGLSVGGVLTNTGGLQIVTVPEPSHPGASPAQVDQSVHALNNSGGITIGAQFGVNGDAVNSGNIDVEALAFSAGFVVGGTLTNTSTGQILIDYSSSVGAANLANAGTIQVQGPYAELSVSDNLTNTGTITASGQHLQISVGGRFTNEAGGMFKISGSGNTATVANLINLGSVTVGNGSALTVPPPANASGNVLSGFLNAGTVLIQSGGAISTPGAYTQTAGQTTIDGELSGRSNFAGGSVYGNDGTLSGNVTSNAAFNIGDAPMTVGQLSIMGNYTQGPNGSLTFDIASLSSYDQLNVNGHASLNGLMTVDLLHGYIPQIGNMFDIMNFASESGTFSMVVGLPINSQEHFNLEYNATNLTLDVVAGPGSPGVSQISGLSKGEAFIPSGSGNNQLLAMSLSGESASAPEPGSILLLGTGIVAIAGALRRRKYL